MKILGIDTSCDETSVAVVEGGQTCLSAGRESLPPTPFTVLSNVIASQVEIHKEYGGVYPTLARREHEKNLTPVLGKALKEADLLRSGDSFIGVNTENPTLNKKLTKFLKNYQAPNLDAIAVTTGPGLDPCLWTGINFAEALAENWNLPLIPVNHLEAHILSNFITNKASGAGGRKSSASQKPSLPALALIVSGGHTQLVLVKEINNYKLLGETRDDAAGECFDKTARLLGLSYPGGPAIEEKAAQTDIEVELPRPMINSDDYDFSFSGLKTAVLYKVNEDEEQLENEDFVKAMAYEIQEAVTEVLTEKTFKAAREYKVNSILLGGGVAANQRLRERIKSDDFEVHIPPLKLCTDNGAVIAATAFYHEPIKLNKLKAKPNLRL